MSLVKLFAAVTMFAASPAAAQFTTVIPPRAPAETSAAVAAAESAAVRDTLTATRMQSMREWVDSAAVALDVNVPDSDSSLATDSTRSALPRAAGDSVSRDAPAPGQPRREADAPPAFRDGAPAPDTATMLPLLALAGVGALVAGAWLLRR